METTHHTKYYLTSDDGSVKLPVVSFAESEAEEADRKEIKEALDEYKWRDDDILLTTYPKTGTYFMWEIMSMLKRGSDDYIKESKALCQIDMYPVTRMDEVFPRPRVMNTHYRVDVLPKEFRGRKTVCVLRNPKDTIASYFKFSGNMDCLLDLNQVNDLGKMHKMSLSDFATFFLHKKGDFFGNYFDYVGYMWSLRDDPNLLIVFYEDLILDPVGEIQRVNEFMETHRTPELVQQIADATSFSKMKAGKFYSMVGMNKVFPKLKMKFPSPEETTQLHYRKGTVGDWKNQSTVAINELVDSFLEKWEAGKGIPFKYSC